VVGDVVASADYCGDKLGFTYDRLRGDPPDFCMVGHDGQTVMLSQAPAAHEIVRHWRVVDTMWNAYFCVEDVEALYAEYRVSGATIDCESHTKPYGMKEFGVQDLDGYDLAIGQQVKL